MRLLECHLRVLKCSKAQNQSNVTHSPWWHSVLNVKAVVGAFNQEKALVRAFSVIVQPVVEPMDRFAALFWIFPDYSLFHPISKDG